MGDSAPALCGPLRDRAVVSTQGAGKPTRIGSIVVDPDVDDGQRFANTDKACKL